MAEGVLPVFVGKATRLVEYLSVGAKAYRATVQLGVRTDTLDRDGQVIDRRDHTGVARSDIESLLPEFTGTISQTPPMYSALKREGERLHRLARRGVIVEREPREAVIHSIDLLKWAPPTLVLHVVCGGGTYVRVIAADLGDRLGCGTTLNSLVRSRVGPFQGDQTVPLHEVVSYGRSPAPDDPIPSLTPLALIPLETLFRGWLSLHLNEDGLRLARTGSPLSQGSGEWGRLPGNAEPPFVPAAPNDRAIALGPDGRFAAVLEGVAPGEHLWRPKKVFVDRRDESDTQRE